MDVSATSHLRRVRATFGPVLKNNSTHQVTVLSLCGTGIQSSGVCCLLCVQSFLSILCAMKWGTFLFFAGWVLIMTLFVIFCVPETKVSGAARQHLCRPPPSRVAPYAPLHGCTRALQNPCQLRNIKQAISDECVSCALLQEPSITTGVVMLLYRAYPLKS